MPPKVKGKLWTALKAVDVDLERHIKSVMPVDTGRARASWGRWTQGDIRKPNPKASAADAVHKEKGQGTDDMEITQGSNVPYISVLNAGHSKQAPAGFIELGEDMAGRDLKARAEVITRQVKP